MSNSMRSDATQPKPVPSTPLGLSQKPTPKWSLAARIFHWGGALLLLLTWLMIVLDENSEGDSYIKLHMVFGFSVFCWTLARLINRLLSRTPPPLPMPAWQKAVAHLTHIALYALLLAMPMSGMLMSWYAGKSIDLLGLLSLPNLVDPNRTQARFFNNLHTNIIWPTILVFSALHIGAALYHQFIRKDGILLRMK